MYKWVKYQFAVSNVNAMIIYVLMLFIGSSG